VTGGGSSLCDVTLLKYFYRIGYMKPEIDSDVYLSVVTGIV